MRTVKLFVEGGGNGHSLRTECRAAFNKFLYKAGFSGYMPRIVACGSRNEAYSSFCTAIEHSEEAILLVDSESPVIMPQCITDNPETWKPWHHLKNRRSQDDQIADGWDKPDQASDADCHLMVQSMETWFLADVDALKEYYGQDFKQNCLSGCTDIENIAKDNVIASLVQATRHTSKGGYDKGRHSFELLSNIDPDKVTRRSPWANRFVTLLLEKMQA